MTPHAFQKEKGVYLCLEFVSLVLGRSCPTEWSCGFAFDVENVAAPAQQAVARIVTRSKIRPGVILIISILRKPNER